MSDSTPKLVPIPKLETQADFFKALAHPSRLLILGLCQQKPRHAEELAGLLKLSKATVSHHLSLLSSAGLLEPERQQYYQNYKLNPAMFELSLKTMIFTRLEDSHFTSDPFRSKVLRDFFKHGRLIQIPAQRKKRDIILEKIVQSFEFDRTYPEKEVNTIILEFHDDFATLRRELIGLGLLTRENGIYSRVTI
jgi:ArsR family transcriptional regulator, arsenate/arsenite/antimonite-responsive transcriptional repressor